ncbi:MAG: iron-containing alcohol dehydrogenase [Deltaproteobacteria bacterium]
MTPTFKGFDFYRTPKLFFGPGRVIELGPIAASYGSEVLVVTGGDSLDRTGNWKKCEESLEGASLRVYRYRFSGEPSPETVDSAVKEYAPLSVEVVVAVGGGSAVDCAKAIAAMLPLQDPVKPYLEGLGTKTHPGNTLPVIAVPTTAGTGSEATKNAVISRVGRQGFKKSLRHDNFTPACAIVDPELTLTCPSQVTAACGMDAFTQLLESYVSPQASPVTDALALSGIQHMAPALIPASTDQGGDLSLRSSLAYAAFLSGVTLANAGLGIIHGLAAALGGLFPIPHGIVCATLLAEACRMNIKRIRERSGPGDIMLAKFATLGRILSGGPDADIPSSCDLLLRKLDEWTLRPSIPRLGQYGVSESDLDALASQAGQKNNPIQLAADDVKTILRARL